ncbi:hypothetical protein B484DRAFT_462189, partial [Ochromonadaceae sp. CCMP2298]
GARRCVVLGQEVREKILALIAEQPEQAALHTASLQGRLYHMDEDTAAAGTAQPLPNEEPQDASKAQAPEVHIEPWVFSRDRAEIMGSHGTLRPGSTAGLNPLEVLHLRTSHSSKATILAGLKVNAFRGAGTTYEACKKLEIRSCDPCLRGGERQGHIFRSSRDFTELLPMQDVGLDPVKLSTPSIGGEHYANFAHCYATRLAGVVAAKDEGNQVAVIKTLQRDWCIPYGHTLKTLHTDSGKIFLGHAVQEYL